MSILKINNISFQYQDRTPILEHFSMTLDHRDMLMIEGQSGSGKSTLIHLIAGHIIPTSGNITLFNKDFSKLSDNEAAKVRRKIGMITQFNTLLKDMSVIENVMMPMLIDGKSNKDSYDKASSLLEEVGLKSKIHKSVLELSGGESQRVGIARALANDPQIILADEPTASLDKDNAENILSMCIAMVRERNVPLLWTTHNSNQRHLFNKNIIMRSKNID